MPLFGFLFGPRLDDQTQAIVNKLEDRFSDFNLVQNFAILQKNPREPGAVLYFQLFNTDLLTEF